MIEELFGLTSEQIERLRRLLDQAERDSGAPPGNRGRRNLQPSRIVVGALTSAVAATTALLGPPQVGTLNVYSFTSTGTTDTGNDITVYNFAPQAATTDRWTICERDSLTGKWMITTQFCS